MSITLCVLLWAHEGSEGALDHYMKDERRAALADDRDRAITRTEVMRVDLV